MSTDDEVKFTDDIKVDAEVGGDRSWVVIETHLATLGRMMPKHADKEAKKAGMATGPSQQ